MRLSHQVQYAICGIFDLAYNGQAEAVQIRVISERQAIPARYLEQIFQRLRRADLVTGKRGPGGGYTLSRPAAEISLRDVVEAVEGSLGPTSTLGAPSRERDSAYRPDFVWAELAARFARALEDVTLEDLCREAARSRVERAAPDAPMYFI